MELTLNQTLEKATSLLSEDKFEKAKTLYQSILEVEPSHLVANINLSITLQLLGNLKEAEISYKKTLTINPVNRLLRNNLGIVLHDLKKLDEAESVFKKAIELGQSTFETYISLGKLLIEQGKLEEAEINYKKAIELKPDRFNAFNNLGVLLHKLGKFDKAVVIYKKAIELKPDFIEAYYNLANALMKLDRLKESETNYRKAIKLDPTYILALHNLALLLEKIGKPDEGEACYKKIIELKSDYVQAYYNLGKLLNAQGRFKEAEVNLKKVILLKPNYLSVHHNLGLIFFERYQFKNAVDQFLLSDLHVSKLFLLKCFFELDEKSNFYNHLDHLIKKDENNAVIGSMISRSNIRYETNKSNTFCNNPLKYSLTTDLTKICNFKNVFINAANDILRNIKVPRRIQGLLTSGNQTVGNLFTTKDINTNEIQSTIHSEIEKYRHIFRDSEEGFLKNWPKNYYLHGWIVCMKNGGKISPHMHEYGWLSGSIYINVPKKLKPDSGNLVVCIEDEKKLTDKNNNQKKSIDVVTGSLALFPSSLLHYTIPFVSKEDRIVLAFDIIPK